MMNQPKIPFNPVEDVFQTYWQMNDHAEVTLLVPDNIQDGDQLPKMEIKFEGEKQPFQIHGRYVDEEKNLEFIYDGPIGYSYKLGLSLLSNDEVGYEWKTKKQGFTKAGKVTEDDIIFVPKYILNKNYAFVETDQMLNAMTMQDTLPEKLVQLKFKVAIKERTASEVMEAIGDVEQVTDDESEPDFTVVRSQETKIEKHGSHLDQVKTQIERVTIGKDLHEDDVEENHVEGGGDDIPKRDSIWKRMGRCLRGRK